MATKLTWVPRRRGPIFCSSACGCRCRWVDHERYRKRAQAVARQLGKGWKARVWENLGWHAEVFFGGLYVSLHSTINGWRYSAHLGERGHGGAFSSLLFADGSTPVQAIQKLRINGVKWIRRERRTVDNAEHDLLRCGV